MTSADVPWELLFQQAPTGYLTTTDAGVVELVNETFLRWTGLRREDVVGTPLTRLMPVGDRILYTTHCSPRLAMDGSVDEVALEFVAADGTRRAALLSAVRTPARAGEPASVRVAVFGAHERRRFEHDLLAARQRAEESEARRARVESELQHRARHDPLTGLRNRTALLDDLEQLLAAPRTATGPALAVLYVDLDNFKAVNDALGHAAGDELLVHVADRLRSPLLHGAALARLAGDEFVVVAQVEGPRTAGSLAERLLAELAEPVVVHGLELVLSASVGVTVAEADGDDAETLLHRADVAMYRAKAAGRGGWQVQLPTDEDPTAGRLRMIGELRHGIAAGQLVVEYQPRVELRTGRLDGTEALVRWRHPVRGLLAPGEFIALAESSGLVRELGARVIDQAVARCAAWRAGAGTADLGTRVAVNLSARQLGDPRLPSLVRGALLRHGLPAAALTLEITETALVDDPVAAGAALDALSDLGVRLAIDDFGTGYASLTYLKQLTVAEIKIDRQFVAGLGTDRGDRAIVAACIQLAHGVGTVAVAEGVETAEQRDLLAELGCDVVQGYLYSRPLGPVALAAWARAAARAPAGRDREPTRRS